MKRITEDEVRERLPGLRGAPDMLASLLANPAKFPVTLDYAGIVYRDGSYYLLAAPAARGTDGD